MPASSLTILSEIISTQYSYWVLVSQSDDSIWHNIEDNKYKGLPCWRIACIAQDMHANSIVAWYSAIYSLSAGVLWVAFNSDSCILTGIWYACW